MKQRPKPGKNAAKLHARFLDLTLRKLKNLSTNTAITKECMKTARITKNIMVKKAAKAAPTANADVKTAKAVPARKARNVRATVTKSAARNTAAVHASMKKAVRDVQTVNADARTERVVTAKTVKAVLTASADAKKVKNAAVITEIKAAAEEKKAAKAAKTASADVRTARAATAKTVKTVLTADRKSVV